jgi:DNA-directed RNA polymerase specialized sigma24 family protein
MPTDKSVTTWIELLKQGDEAAAQQLWQRYFDQLVRLARGRLGPAFRRAADEEDVALSAFDSFCQGLRQGRFPRLNDRHDLWNILLKVTVRKAFRLARDETRLKRGGRPAEGGGPAAPPAPADIDLALLVGREPTPEVAAQVADEYRRLHDSLPDDSLRAVMRAKLEGYTNPEIAARLGRTVRTVELKLKTIRALWTKDLEP